MASLDTKAGFLALLGIALRNLDPGHHQSTTEQVVGAAADIYDAAVRHLDQRDADYHNARGDDGLTQAERDAGWTVDQVRARDAVRELPQLPAIAANPGNDQLAVLAALHADVEIISELRAEAIEQQTVPDSTAQLFDEIAEHYPGVANELRAYVLHPDREQAARAAGGARFLLAEDSPASDRSADGRVFDTDEERSGAYQRELDELHRTGQVTDRRVPGPYIPPDSARDTSGDAALIAEDVARQEAGRQAFNLGQSGSSPGDVHATRDPGMHATDRAGNGELPELAAAPGLRTDEGGKLQEIGGGAIQQDDTGGAIQQDDTGGRIVQDDTGGHLTEPLSEQDGGHIQGGDDQGAASAPQQ